MLTKQLKQHSEVEETNSFEPQSEEEAKESRKDLLPCLYFHLLWCSNQLRDFILEPALAIGMLHAYLSCKIYRTSCKTLLDQNYAAI